MPSLRAGDELEFAVPDEGRITLGVFDGSGKLVRVLHKLAKEGEFQVGLNGLITSWDGNNDAGERMPSGHYHVRGYLIGEDVCVSGEDFLFNDWAADSGFPEFNKISDFSLLENGEVILLARSGSSLKSSPGDVLHGSAGVPPADSGSSGMGILPMRDAHSLARFSPDKGFLWSENIEPMFSTATGLPSFRIAQSPEKLLGGLRLSPVFPPLLASNSADVVVATREFSAIYSIEDGKNMRGIPNDPGFAPLALAANDSNVFFSFRGLLTENPLPGLAKPNLIDAPNSFTSMDADASTLIGASPDGVWVRQESFQPITLPTTVKSVSLGMPGTFWFVGEENGAPFVGQASFAGEILRALRPAADDPKPEKIRASRTQEKFAVIESLPGLQRLRVMARAESGEWTIEWERTLRDSANFGFVNGKPAADAGSAAQEKNLRFRLKENPLAGKRDFLTVHAEFDGTGSRLVSPDGLPLVEISSRNDIRRSAIRRGDKPDTLRLLQGNSSFVEEFSIAGLDDILPLDAGGIDLP